MKNFRLLTGPDDYRLRDRIRFYKRAFLQKYPEGQIDNFSAETDLEMLFQSALTPDLFGAKRLIITENFWDPQKFDAALRADFFSRVADSSDFVTILCIEATLDQRTKYAKFLESNATVENFALLDRISIITWISNQVAKKGGKINRTVIEKLLSITGENLWILSGEIEKLLALAPDGNITESHLKVVVNRTPVVENFIFSLLQEIVKRNIKVALGMFQKLLKMGESPYVVLAMLMREIRIHTLIREGKKMNLDRKNLAEKTGLHPFVIQKAEPHLLSESVIGKLYDRIFLLDRDIKIGKIYGTTDDNQELELRLERLILTL